MAQLHWLRIISRNLIQAKNKKRIPNFKGAHTHKRKKKDGSKEQYHLIWKRKKTSTKLKIDELKSNVKDTNCTAGMSIDSDSDIDPKNQKKITQIKICCSNIQITCESLKVQKKNHHMLPKKKNQKMKLNEPGPLQADLDQLKWLG